MDIREWASVLNLEFVFGGNFDPRKNSGYINVYLRRIDVFCKLEVEGDAKISYGRSGETPMDNRVPKIPILDEAITDLANEFSEKTLTDGKGFNIEAPVLTYDGKMLYRKSTRIDTKRMPKRIRGRQIVNDYDDPTSELERTIG